MTTTSAFLPYVGIDIGGTSTRIGRFAAPAAREFALVERFPTEQRYDLEIQHIEATIASGAPPAGIGLSVGAQLARDGRSVREAANLKEYVDRPLADTLQSAFGCPVRMAHDPVCGVLAELRHGVLAGRDRCGYLTISTGTGCAVHVRDGDVAITMSIQASHQILDGNPLVCLCGQTGCLETITGGKQIALRLGRSPAEIDDPAFWEIFCEKMALGLVNLTHLTRIDTLAVSGGIVAHRPDLVPRIQGCVNARLRNTTLTLVPAALGEDAPIIGAVTLLGDPPPAVLH